RRTRLPRADRRAARGPARGRALRGSRRRRTAARARATRRASSVEELPERLVDGLWVRLALRDLHHLADEEAHQAGLTSSVLLHLRGEAREDFLHLRRDGARVYDLREPL